MNDKGQTIENGLVLMENISVWKKILRKIWSVFSKKEEIMELKEERKEPLNIIIPEAVQMPERIKQTYEDKNSIEYLYKLSDEQLNELNLDYDKQIENSKNEIVRLEGILKNYKKMIQKLQNKVTEEL